MSNFIVREVDDRRAVIVSPEALAWLAGIAKVVVAGTAPEDGSSSSSDSSMDAVARLARQLERMYLTAHKRASAQFRVCLPHQASVFSGAGAYAFASPAFPMGPVIQEGQGGWDRASIVDAFRAAQKGRCAPALAAEIAPFVSALIDGPGVRVSRFMIGKTTSQKPKPGTVMRSARARLLRDGLCSRFNHKYKEHGFTHLIAVAAFERRVSGRVADYDYRAPEDEALALEGELFRMFREHPRFAADVSKSSSGGLAQGKAWQYTAMTYIAITVTPSGECGCAPPLPV
jgi:hypothetical protein